MDLYEGRLSKKRLLDTAWRFMRSDGSVVSECIRLCPDGRILGHDNSNEKGWSVAKGQLAFLSDSGQTTTLFGDLDFEKGFAGEDRVKLSGYFLDGHAKHVLKQRTVADEIVEAIEARLLGKKGESFDLIKIAELKSAFSSAEYYSKNMRMSLTFNNKYEQLISAMRLRRIKGLCLEFGVATGQTINVIASETEGVVHGFDAFKGLPENWRAGFSAGAFAQGLPHVLANVELVVGLFEDTLPPFLKGTDAPVSFLHVDCDIYSSTACIFRHLGPRIFPGTVIVFDEYINFVGWENDEFKAFQEFIVSRGHKYKYHSIVRADQQVCVIIES